MDAGGCEQMERTSASVLRDSFDRLDDVRGGEDGQEEKKVWPKVSLSSGGDEYFSGR